MTDSGNASLWTRIGAWAVHMFTASGIVSGVLAVIAVFRHEWVECFWWLIAATAIDSVDGMLARLAKVKRVVPGFDGALLDNISDYFTYVIVPALFVYERGMTPPGFVWFAVTAMLLSSAYQFCRTDAKTEDHFFTGWPSYWNILVLYLFLLDTGPWVNGALIATCAVLVFVPIRYLYPSRTTKLRGVTQALTAGWGVSMIVLLVQYPAPNVYVLWGSLAYVVYYTMMSLILTRGRTS